MSEIYGQLESEKLAADNKVAHEIVREINHFGINDRQRWLIIYYLGLELENVDELKELTGFVKEFKGKTSSFPRSTVPQKETSNGKTCQQLSQSSESFQE